MALDAVDDVELDEPAFVEPEPEPIFVHLWVDPDVELELELGLELRTGAPSGTYRFWAGALGSAATG